MTKNNEYQVATTFYNSLFTLSCFCMSEISDTVVSRSGTLSWLRTQVWSQASGAEIPGLSLTDFWASLSVKWGEGQHHLPVSWGEVGMS